MTKEQKKLFDDLMDMYEFEVYKNENGKLQVTDLQGGNLGDIESDEFNDEWDIIERMEVYHIDYIIDPLLDCLAEEHNMEFEYHNWEDLYNQIKDLGIEDLSYNIKMLGLIVGYKGESEEE